jgi:hypothetical protein
MSEKRGLLAKLFGPKEIGCCGVEFEKADEAPPAVEPAPPTAQSISCCSSAKRPTPQEP